jgi:transcriptional antiterminator Rof (Rho-off)
MARNKKMSDKDLLSLIKRRAESGLNYDDSVLSHRREKLLEQYLGKPRGDEQDGSSQIVTRQCLEAVEWTLPSLLRIFLGAPFVAEFSPEGPEDEELAKQETIAVNQVLKQNDGFMTIMTWIKDSLMSPVAYIKVYWEETSRREVETLHSLLAEEVDGLMQDPEAEIEGYEESVVIIRTPMGEQPVPVFDVDVAFTRKGGRVVIELVPGEDIVVDGKLKGVSLEKADFIDQRLEVTRSDLIDSGFSKQLVESLTSVIETKAETTHRKTAAVGEEGTDKGQESSGEAMDLIELHETYIRVDYDGDGVAEFRRILSANDEEILENDEVSMIPFVALCAIPIPHTHIGQAWAEPVADLQEVNTTLTRQLLNNMYRSNNPRPIVGPGVNMSDVMSESAANMPIRAMNLGNIRMEPTLPIIDKVLPAFDWLEHVGEKRIGVSKSTMGLDADQLSRVTKGAFLGSLEQSNQRLEALARIIAESGLKPLMLKAHRLLATHQDTEYQLRDGKAWVRVDPREWRDRDDMEITVGLGTGNKQAQLVGLDKVFERQMQLKQMNSRLVTEQNEYEASAKMIEIVGLHNPDRYFTNPQMLGPKPEPQPDPLAQAQMKLADAEMAKVQTKAESDEKNREMKYFEQEMKLKTKIAELEAKLQDSERLQYNAEHEQMRKDYEFIIKSEIEQARLNLDELNSINEPQEAFRNEVNTYVQ